MGIQAEMRKRKIALLLLLAAIFCAALAGCGSGTEKEREGREVEFTVADRRKLPAELQEAIEEHKKEEIRMTYLEEGELYVIRGYGEQKTGGYSISVVRCVEDDETVWLDTRLIGPESPKNLAREPSYPVLVIKMEARDKNVVIQ